MWPGGRRALTARPRGAAEPESAARPRRAAVPESAARPRRAAVLGKPVAHSLSPALHRAAYAAMGLHSWHYQAIEVDEAGLAGWLAGLDAEWAGLSLTMPLKRSILPHLATVTPLAAAVGAVNTVLVRAGEPPGGGDGG